MFDELQGFLRQLLPQVMDKQAGLAVEPLPQVPADRQHALCTDIMQRLGFDAQRGRLDISVHPFCGGATSDVRMTTAYQEDNFAFSLFGLIHETGHAIYEQNKPAAQGQWYGQPVGMELGMMIHEWQSLFHEMQLGLSQQFLEWIAPVCVQTFGLDGAQITSALLTRTMQRVQPSLIRIAADEVTYPLHIILRTEIESAFVNGEMEAHHVRDAWHAGIERLLGITVPDDKQGVLQDVHWPEGLIGYFPCYSQGTIVAAALFDRLQQDLPDVCNDIGRGEFGAIQSWLKDKVHSEGSRYNGFELVERVTGAPLSLKPFMRHLEKRYLG